MPRKSFVTAIILILGALLLVAGCSSLERKLLFLPSHHPLTAGLAAWTNNGETIGFARKVAEPANVWLLLHGNAGQAADRAYALPSFSSRDSVFILEYPGYGTRSGTPSAEAFNHATQEAYQLLRTTYPKIPVCVAGESIGTGPACFLATLPQPPDKFVLIVAFDRLSAVAEDHFPSFLVGLLLKDNWDNIAALAHYPGPVAVFGAEADTVIPVAHAQALATAVPSASFTLVPGGHNDWPQSGRVQIRNP